MKKLNANDLKTRREFLKQAGRKIMKPVVVAYALKKTTLPIFGREPD